MKILGVDTCLPVGGVALVENENILSSLNWGGPKEHASRLQTALDFVISAAGLTLSKIDMAVFTAGPGSFTGVRICLSMAKALSLSKKTKVVTVSTLEALTTRYLDSGFPVLAILEARRDRFYVLCRDADKEIIPHADVSLRDLIQNIEELGLKNMLLVGNALRFPHVKQALRKFGTEVDPYERSAAVDACTFALKYGWRDSLEAVYVRKPDAKPPDKKAV